MPYKFFIKLTASLFRIFSPYYDYSPFTLAAMIKTSTIGYQHQQGYSRPSCYQTTLNKVAR